MLICHSYYQQWGIFMCNASTQLDVDVSCFKMMDCLPFLDILAGKKDEKYNIFLLETKQWPGIAGLLDGIPMPDLSSQKEETPLVCCRLQCCLNHFSRCTWWFRFCVILAPPFCSFKVVGLRNAWGNLCRLSGFWKAQGHCLPRLRIFALHSMIPRQEQEEVFNEVPKARWFGRFLSGRLIFLIFASLRMFKAWFEHANYIWVYGLRRVPLSSFADIPGWSRPPIRRNPPESAGARIAVTLFWRATSRRVLSHCHSNFGHVVIGLGWGSTTGGLLWTPRPNVCAVVDLALRRSVQ